MRVIRSKSVVGLDIEPTYVAAVEGAAGRVSVERAAVAPLEPGIVRDGEVIEVDALAGVLRNLFAEHKLSRRVRIGLANQRIVMRTIDLPPLDDPKQIASAVRFQASEHIPMPLEQAVLEHQSLGRVQTPDGPRTRVVVVAGRRDMVERLLEVTRRAGLRAHGIDLSAFAMVRALHRPERSGSTVYMSIGGLTNVAIAVDRTCVFTRVTPNGLESMAIDLAERRGLTREHAHGWLVHTGLSAPLDEVEGDEAIIAEARAVLTDGVSRIAHEVRSSLDYYAMQDPGTAVEHAVLTGPALAVPGLSDYLGSELGVTVEPGAVGGRGSAAPNSTPGHLAVAAGLTVEELAA